MNGDDPISDGTALDRHRPIPAGDVSDSLHARVTVTTDPPDWSAFLAGRDDATIYHDPRWGEVMREAYGNRPHYLTARRGGSVVGICQLIEQRSLLFGKRLCSLPYFDASGILADDPPAEAALLDAVGQLRGQTGVDHVELRQLQPLSAELPTRTDKVTLWLGLGEGRDATWKQFKKQVRTNVRRAMKNDVEVVCGGGEHVKSFYSVYSRTMRDLGSPPHSLRFFRVLIDRFAEEVRLFIARRQETVVAASLTLTDRRAMRVPWAGSDYRYRKLDANRLMYWEMLATGSDLGCAAFDFGRSTRDSGTHKFKRGWGAEEVPLYWHHVMPPGQEPPELRPDSPKYRMMVRCWQKLPVPLARLLGPRLIAKLS